MGSLRLVAPRQSAVVLEESVGCEVNVIDVLVVGLVLLGGLQGYYRGLITGVANFLAGIAGFVVAALEYAKVLAWAEQQFNLQSWLEPQVFRLIWPLVEVQGKNLNGKVLGGITQLAPDLSSGLVNGNIPGLSSVVQGVMQQVGHRLAGIVTENILRLVAFGVVFYAVVLAAQIALAFLLKPLGIVGGGLNLDLWTNKGADNLLYHGNDTLKLYTRSNHECYLRFVYYMADGSKVLLMNDYYIGSDQVNKVVQIPENFICAEPFGIESLVLNGQTTPFPKLSTTKRDGYIFIDNEVKDIVSQSRGFKRLNNEMLNGEKRLIINTLN